MCTSPDQLSDIISAYFVCCRLLLEVGHVEESVYSLHLSMCNPAARLQQQLKVCDLHITVVIVNLSFDAQVGVRTS